MTKRITARHRIVLFMLVLVTVSMPLRAAATSPSWHTVLTARMTGAYPLGWASGRVWFAVEDLHSNVTVWSARVGSAGLTSLVSTPEGQREWVLSAYIAGSSLVAPSTQPGGSNSSIAGLSASGKLAAWGSLPNDPEKAVEDAFTPTGQTSGKWLADAAVTVGGRSVWAVGGLTCPSTGPHKCTVNGGGFPHLGLCCTAGGEPSDLSSLVTVTRNEFAGQFAFAIDLHHRLWMAVSVGARASRGVALKLVQLDPDTLVPITVKTLDPAPINDRIGGRSFVLACADLCRLVYEGQSGLSVWSGSSVALLSTNDPRKGTSSVAGATARGAGFALASEQAGVASGGLRVAVSRVAAGKTAHVIATADLKLSIPHGAMHAYALLGNPFAIASPSGFAWFAYYQSDDGSPSKLLGTVLHG